jgi:hypothetical protein
MGRHAVTHDIRMGCHLQSKPGTSRGIYVSISASVVTDVGWEVDVTSPTRKSVLIAFDEGVGADAGYILLSQDDSEGYACGTTKDKGQAFCMNVSVLKLAHYVMNEVPYPTRAVDFTIDHRQRAIKVKCPDWLRYNPQSYKETEVEQPLAAARQKAAPRKMGRRG